jgi:hypothetical protein
MTRATGNVLFARKETKEIARFSTTQSILMHEHCRRVLAPPFEQSLSHGRGNLSVREKQCRNREMPRDLSIINYCFGFATGYGKLYAMELSIWVFHIQSVLKRIVNTSWDLSAPRRTER